MVKVIAEANPLHVPLDSRNTLEATTIQDKIKTLLADPGAVVVEEVEAALGEVFGRPAYF